MDSIRVLTVDQCIDLMAYLEAEKPALVRYYALALFAAVRPIGELEKLGNDMIDLGNSVVRIPASVAKTGRARQVSMRPNLVKWLQRYPGLVLPFNHNRLRQEVRRRFNLSQDVLRHTGISAMVG